MLVKTTFFYDIWTPWPILQLLCIPSHITKPLSYNWGDFFSLPPISTCLSFPQKIDILSLNSPFYSFLSQKLINMLTQIFLMGSHKICNQHFKKGYAQAAPLSSTVSLQVTQSSVLNQKHEVYITSLTQCSAQPQTRSVHDYSDRVQCSTPNR